MTEIILAFLGNIKNVAGIISICIAAGIGLGIMFLPLIIDMNEDFVPTARKALKWMLIALALLLPLACVPSIDDLWKVRIGLLKFHLASPENVGKATDEIARIGKALECKYLNSNCEEKGK